MTARPAPEGKRPKVARVKCPACGRYTRVQVVYVDGSTLRDCECGWSADYEEEAREGLAAWVAAQEAAAAAAQEGSSNE